MSSRSLAVPVAIVLLAACGGGDDAATTTDVSGGATTTEWATTVPATSGPATSGPATTAASSVARNVLDEVVGWLNGDAIDEAVYAARFSPAFTQAVPFAAFQPTLAQLQASAPWALDGEPEELEAGVLVAALTNARDERASLQLVLADPAEPVIDSVQITPIVDPPASSDEAMAELQSLGTLRLVTAEITGDGCAAISDQGGDDLMPLGSVFKLYVLGAVVDAVEGGTLTWDAPVTIRDELDSLPSGTTQDEPAGTQLPVRELATRMISVSDNTATDHLIDLVGRDAVEAALAAYGHATPAATLPFVTTRELFVLKFPPGDLLARYVEASIEERRTILVEEVATAPLPDPAAVATTTPVAIDEAEWFASPLDICRALARLSRSSDALEILAVNPGVPAPAGRWTYLGFKGGSEPGVLAVAWLVEDAAGRRFALAGGVANQTTPIAEELAVTNLAFLRDTIER